VRIEVGDKGVVEATVTTVGWRLAPDEVTIVENQTGDRIRLEVKLPRQSWNIGFTHRSVAVTVRVPREADVDIKTGDGSVSVPALRGRLDVSTGDGSITAEGSEGDVRLHTGDGSIRASGVAGRLRANTGDGRIHVDGRFDSLDLRTGDGGIDADVAPGSKLAGEWSFQSGDGSITLRLPSDLQADLDAHTGDGHIDLDLPVSVTGSVSRTSVRGKLGGGGPALRVQTGDGSIRIAASRGSATAAR
jgi:DUF4097 and DUF4098 domain-containing protein YvlB